MQRSVWWVLPVMLLVLSGGPARADEAPQSASSRAGFVSPSVPGMAAAYRNWPAVSRLAHSGLHWQNEIVVYASRTDTYRHNQRTLLLQQEADSWTASAAVRQEAAASRFLPYDAGTVLVKENHVRDAAGALVPLFLTIMLKRAPGFDPEHGDWEYLQSSPGGEVLLRGTLMQPQVHVVCGECHANVPERDYVFGTAGLGSE